MEQMEIEEPGPDEATGQDVALLARYKKMCSLGYKWQMVLIISFVVLLAAGMYTIVRKKNRPITASSHLFCNTMECSQTAAHIRSFVSPSADPCDNFYKFACGNFHKHYDSNTATVVSMYRRDWESSLLSLVVDEQINESKWKVTKNLKLARKFYKACMNITVPHKNPDLAFLDAIGYITGSGVPKTHTNMKSLTWWDVMLKSREIGMNFDFFLNVNITKFPNPHFQISPPDVDLMMLFHKLWVPRHQGYIRQIAEYWGYNDASLFWEFEDTSAFANKLMELVLASYVAVPETDVKSVTLTKISDLPKTRDSDPDWLPFLQNITGVADLRDTEVVYFKMKPDSHKNYLSRLAKLIEATPTRLWMNYVVAYHIVREYQYLSQTVQVMVNKIMEVEKDSDRHDFCVFETGKYFHADIEKVLVNHIVTPDKIKNIQRMYNFITQALERHLKQAHAFNVILREEAVRQLKNISLHVGGNDYFFNDSMFDETFGIKPDELSDNAIEALHVLEKFRVDHMHSLIRRPSAFYNRSLDMEDIALTYTRDNSLYLFAPVLRDPTYSLNRPEYINYGSLGTMIAHEVSRMYNDIIFDQISSSSLPDWQAEMQESTENSLVCANQSYISYYQKQFNTSNIPLPDLETPVSDSGSANIAYLAYLDYVNATGTEPKIAGISYDPSQVFWIMASTFYCNNQQLEESEDAWNADFQRFQLPSYRVNGPKMNSLYFHQHFNCSLGTNMNPNRKCTPFP